MTVAIGMPIYGGIPTDTVMSLFKTVMKCTSGGLRLDFITLAAPYIHISRDMIVDEFLKGNAQKLFFIDHDESWEVDDFIRLVALSTVHEVVGATYPAKSYPLRFDIAWLPEAKAERFNLMKVGGLGLGFCIIDRSVLERLAAKAPRVRHWRAEGDMASIFRLGAVDGKYVGEDIAFFSDVRELGVDVWLDPTIQIGHIGQHEWKGRVLDTLQLKQEKLSERHSDAASGRTEAGTGETTEDDSEPAGDRPGHGSADDRAAA